MNNIQPIVEIEESLYSYAPAQNGAGPLWSHGNTCIVRHGENVFASGLETVQNVEPLNNVRWMLFKRGADGWKLQQVDEHGLQREPCPLGIFSDGRLLLSNNPTLTAPNTFDGPANPHLLEFSTERLTEPPKVLQPVWAYNPGFNEHSYRGMGVDGVHHEVALFNNYAYDEQHWSFLDRNGEWANHGIIHFPVRCCYQNVALRDRVCHVQAVSDILEPNPTWRAWKKEFNQGREWDYVFRRLFYLSNSNIATQQFSESVELDNVDETAGHFRNLDLWIDRDGSAHLLYLKKTVGVPEMRDVFFPGVPVVTSIEYCVVKDNQLLRRRTLFVCDEDQDQDKAMPLDARFHATPDGRLFVLYSLQKIDTDGKEQHQNLIFEILSDGSPSESVKVEMEKPVTVFQTANERGGSTPSNFIDIYGSAIVKWGEVMGTDEIRYARIRLC